MTVDVIEPHGFCAGVKGALEKALSLLSAAAEPVYCLHELVHNALVVSDLAARGMRFVESIEDVPEGAPVLFSAHGVPPSVRARAAARHLRVTDATCPFVARVHREAAAYSAQGLPVVIIGKPNHAEAVGIAGECARVFFDGGAMPPPGSRIGVVSQTTMNADDVARTVATLRQTYAVESVAQVCHATKERQDAVRCFAGDAVLVLGGVNSSNTRRLVEVAIAAGKRAWRAGTPEEVRAISFEGVRRLGVTSGASTPESLLDAVVAMLGTRRAEGSVRC